jgi:hypothetical protein
MHRSENSYDDEEIVLSARLQAFYSVTAVKASGRGDESRSAPSAMWGGWCAAPASVTLSGQSSCRQRQLSCGEGCAC